MIELVVGGMVGGVGWALAILFLSFYTHMKHRVRILRKQLRVRDTIIREVLEPEPKQPTRLGS